MREHDWAGGNDIMYCRECGIEYSYTKEPRPEGECKPEEVWLARAKQQREEIDVAEVKFFDDLRKSEIR